MLANFPTLIQYNRFIDYFRINIQEVNNIMKPYIVQQIEHVWNCSYNKI